MAPNLENEIKDISISNGSKAELEEQTHGYAAEILNYCTLPMVLNSTIELGVLKLLSDEGGSEGLSPSEIAAKIHANNPDAPVMLDRMLRLLTTFSVLSCRVTTTADGAVERRYSPMPVVKCFVPNEDGVSLAAMLRLVLDGVFLQGWSKLPEAVLEGGIPFNKVHGMHAFEYPGVDPKFNEIFNRAMYDQSTYIMKKIIKTYKGFDNIETLVDVGGGFGHTLRVVIASYPSLKGINFDLPHVIEHAPPIPGVEHIGGDMFESVPKGDAIFIKWILHDWSDDKCLILLKNCYKALPNHGRVIVVEANITDQPETTYYGRSVSQMDVNMMTQNPGGKERTQKEFESLAKAAGFAGFKAVCCVYNFWVMEFSK